MNGFASVVPSKLGWSRPHKERRFLLPPEADLDGIRDALKAHDMGRLDYDVETVYLKSDDPNVKRRIRIYNGDDKERYIESKQRINGSVSKNRNKFSGKIKDEDVIGRVNYRREAFEDPDLRVTIDRKLKSGDKKLPQTIVEVKTRREVPSWLAGLLPKQARGFSKSKWMRGKVTV